MNEIETNITVDNHSSLSTIIEQIIADLQEGKQQEVMAQIEALHPEELATLLEVLPPKLRSEFWDDVPEERDGEVLAYVSDDLRNALIDDMEEEELVAAAGMMSENDLALLLSDLSEEKTEQILKSLDEDYRTRLDQVTSFPEDCAGRLMVTDVISVRKDVTLAVVLRWLRRHNQLPPHTEALMVIDEHGRYLGRLSISDLVTNDPKEFVENRMSPGADVIAAETPSYEVARLFERRELGSLAVVDNNGLLIGRITPDEVIDVIRTQGDEQVLKPKGLTEADDLFSPIFISAKRRAIWLGINLITVFLAAGVINNFEEALQKIVALAILMPIVASMGGIAGSQTLTLTLLGMSSERIIKSNVFWLFRKEIAVGMINGIAWATVVGVVAWFWFNQIGLGIILAVAMLINLTAAAASGVFIPLLLKRIGMDPALSGAVVLTTVTDIVGFLSFLGLATLFLL